VKGLLIIKFINTKNHDKNYIFYLLILFLFFMKGKKLNKLL